MNYDSLADLYERQYANYRDDIAFYARLAERENAQDILELGAGAGRVSVALARRGMKVTGLELSAAMLEPLYCHEKMRPRNCGISSSG